MSNELRDPHDPIIPGEHVPSPEGHGGVSMPIGVSGNGSEPEPGLHSSESYEAMQRRVEGELGLRVDYQHVEDTPAFPSAADLDAVEAEKDIADSTAKAEGAKGRSSRTR